MMCSRVFPLAVAMLLASATLPVRAERADRDKPVQLDAARAVMDDKNKRYVLEGDVVLEQGTLQIRSARLEVTQDAAGAMQRSVANGKPGAQAWFRQKREGRDEFVEGQADRIEYDARTERAEFFGNARVKNAQDVVTGPYILYDAKSERYEVGAPPGAAAAVTGSGRVRAVIQPRPPSETPPAAKPAP